MLENIVNPKSIAVIGASVQKEKLGSMVLENVATLGFKDRIYPINPKEKEILNLKCYSSVKDVEGEIDLAVIVVPAKIVEKVLLECGEKKIKGVVIISAGFSEIGVEGKEREGRIKEIAKQFEMTILGPNCLGVLNPKIFLNASFAKGMPISGKVGVVSQSGAMMVALMDWARNKQMGFSKLLSVGNKAGVSENEMLDYFLGDDDTEVIAMYLESFKNGKEFLSKLKKVSKKKPVVVLKAGKSKKSQQAVMSHTGSLAGLYEATEAALRQGAALQVETIEDFCNLILFLDKQGVRGGERVAVVTNAGGPGVVTVDELEENNLKLANLSQDFEDKVSESLPETASTKNPVDVVGDAKADRYRVVFENLLKEEEVDSILTLLTPQVMTEVSKTAESIVELSEGSNKSFIASFMGGEEIKRGRKILEDGNIPNFEFPYEGIRVLSKVSRYLNQRDKISDLQVERVEIEGVREIFEKAKFDKISQLGILETQRLLANFGLELQKIEIGKDLKDIGIKAEKIGYPIVLKTADRKVIHKSDEGGVVLDIKNEKDLQEAFISFEEKGMEKEGLIVQKMVEKGTEIVLGVKNDPQFGPLLMFGLGGIYVEVLKDVSFRVAPINIEEAKEMIGEIKSFKILEGVRGKDAIDIDFIALQIVNLGNLALNFPEIEEIDLNPLIVYNVGGKLVDARIIVKI